MFQPVAQTPAKAPEPQDLGPLLDECSRYCGRISPAPFVRQAGLCIADTGSCRRPGEVVTAAPYGCRMTAAGLVRRRWAGRSQGGGMAQKLTVVLEDDLDGGPADETVRFALDGMAYEIDLSNKHARRCATGSSSSSAMPAGPGGGRAAGAGAARRSGSATRISGCGRKPTASRSATARASRPALRGNTRPPPPAPDPRWSMTGSILFCPVMLA
jgi:nucleoid-associated protein Lsr2